jgi:AGZA family xanthine/uracil permease-like MFS transporter
VIIDPIDHSNVHKLTFSSPGMGLNAYFTYQVVGWHGSGMVPYRIALTAVFVEGLIFLFLALTGMRQWLVKMIPSTIKTACGVGIGLFLTEIGLSYSAGLGAITSGYTTPLAIGGCPAGRLDNHGECRDSIMSNPSVSSKYPGQQRRLFT